MLRRREATGTHPGKDAEEGTPGHPISRKRRSQPPLYHSQVWINQGDIILLSLRDFQDDKADVIVKYTADEARSRTSNRLRYCTAVDLIFTSSPVKAYGELPESAKINETDTFGEEDGECTFEFGDDEEVDIDDI